MLDCLGKSSKLANTKNKKEEKEDEKMQARGKDEDAG